MLGSVLYFFQEKLLFLPETLDDDYEYHFEYPFEELCFETESKGLINAIHFKVQDENKRKGVILYFHGNAGSLARWGKITEYFVKKNYDVLVMDYRTYGKSKGELKEKYFYSDAEHCYDYLLKNYDEKEILVYGRSLGTGIAAYLASENNPDHLILETPYYSIIDVAKARFPVFPVEKLLKYEFPTNDFLKNVNSQITIFHGTEDEIVPYSSGRKLLNVRKNKINFITIEGGNHNNLIEFEEYHRGIDNLQKYK